MSRFILHLDTALLTTARDQPLDHLDTFASSLDAALITKALEVTGTASVRRRKLPAERAVWLMLGMALLRDRSIQARCDHLHLVVPDQEGKTIISSAALEQFLHIPVAEREAVVQPNRVLDDADWEAMAIGYKVSH